MATDLKVSDLQLACLAAMCEEWESIDAVMEEYLTIVKCIAQEAIKDGAVHEAVERLAQNAESIYNRVKGTGNAAAKQAMSFLSTIESIDLKLYDEV